MRKDTKMGGGAAGQIIWDVACRRMSKVFSERVMRNWIEHFTLEELDADRAVIRYDGNLDLENFKGRYLDKLTQCLTWAAGHELKVELYQGKKKIRRGDRRLSEVEDVSGHPWKPGGYGKNVPEKKNRFSGALHVLAGLLILCLVTAVVVVIGNAVRNRDFKETYYQVGSGKISENMRIIQISDLHDSSYGEHNEDLVSRMEELKPDLIVLTGDIIDESGDDDTVALNLCEQLVDLAPVYYVWGNHETMASFDLNDMSIEEIDELLGCDEDNRSSEGFWDMEDDLKDSLEDLGVYVLWNQYETVQIGRSQVDIYGVLTGNAYAFWQYAEDSYTEFRYENTDHFKLLLSHEPYIFETWDGDSWADLSLAGHTHGGEIRLPYIGGLYEYQYGFLPEFGKNDHMISGQYDVEGRPLIISNGMSKGDFLRINNQPELVVVDVNRY